MDPKTSNVEKNRRIRGWIFFSLFVIFILAGIIAKRGFGHPDLVVFFHLPAALFLVLASNALSSNFRKRYEENIGRTSSASSRAER